MRSHFQFERTNVYKQHADTLLFSYRLRLQVQNE